MGIFSFNPPILRMSSSPCSACITLPAPRKSNALKNAWVYRWKIPATNAPEPTARNMYPSCDTVEYAIMRFMSVWARAMVAARKAVTPPTIATQVMAVGDKAYRGAVRAIMYTPAVTIVAAWISALTGVGPSIASGSQTYSGICADLPVAASSNNKPMVVAPTSNA